MMVGLYTGSTPNLAAIQTALGADEATYMIIVTYDLVIGADVPLDQFLRHLPRLGFAACLALVVELFVDNTKNVDELNWQEVLNALYYLQEDALGGSGSRGYGKIEFVDLKLDGIPVILAKNDDGVVLEQRQL